MRLGGFNGGAGCGRKPDPGLGIGPKQCVNCPMYEQGSWKGSPTSIGGIGYPSQESLRLAEGIATQERGPPCGGGGRPPAQNLIEDAVWIRPSIDREPEGTLAYKGMGAQRFKRFGRRVGLPLAVARNDPDLAGDLNANLSRTQNVPGRVKRDAGTPDHLWGSERDPLDGGSGAETRLQDANPRRSSENVTGPRTRVVRVCVGQNGAIYRVPRIHMHVGGGKKEPVGGTDQNGIARSGHGGLGVGEKRFNPRLKGPRTSPWRSVVKNRTVTKPRAQTRGAPSKRL